MDRVEFTPLQFEGCRLEWRTPNVLYKVSLSDLDPLGVKVELRTTPGTTYWPDLWNLILAGANGKEAFEKIEGRGGGSPKRYWSLALLYDDKEKAAKLAEAFRGAIELCARKPQP